MNINDWENLASRNVMRWERGEWMGESSSFEFTTKAGYSACVRRDAHTGHLYGAVAGHKHEPVQHSKFARPYSAKAPVYVIDAPNVPGATWFWFSCGLASYFDLVPGGPSVPWATVYRNAAYVQEQCEKLARAFDALYNAYVLEAARAGVLKPGKYEVSQETLNALSWDHCKKEAAKPEIERCKKHLKTLAAENAQIRNLCKALTDERNAAVEERGTWRAWFVAQVQAREQAPRGFFIKNWRSDFDFLNHEITRVDADTVHVKVFSDRTGLVASEFDVASKDGP